MGDPTTSLPKVDTEMTKDKSKSIDPEAVTAVANEQLSQEVDVSGPLTLEEAKAVGDVPEDFKPETGDGSGILNKASTMVLGGEDEKKVESEDVPTKNVSFADEQPEEIKEDAVPQNVQEKERRRSSILDKLGLKRKSHKSNPEEMAKEKPSDAAEKTAEDAQNEMVTEQAKNDEAAAAEESPTKRKSKNILSSLFHRKSKSKSSASDKDAEAAHPEGAEEVVEHATEEAAKQDESEGIETKKGEDVGAGVLGEIGQDKKEEKAPETEAISPPPPQDIANEETQEKTRVPEADKKKKKGFFAFLHKKRNKDSSESEGDKCANGGVVEETKDAAEGSPTDEGAKDMESGNDGSATTKEEKSTMGFLTRMFHGKDAENPEEKDDNAEKAAVAAGGAALVGGAALATNNANEGEQSTDNSPAQNGENAEGAAAAGKKKHFWNATYPQPAADAEIVKEGKALKQGSFTATFRSRRIRIMSDGLFQWCHEDSDWEEAKAVKLHSKMKIESAAGHNNGRFLLKVFIPEMKVKTFSFEEESERDEWKGAFEGIRSKLQDVQPQIEEPSNKSVNNINNETKEAPQVEAIAQTGDSNNSAPTAEAQM